MWGIVVLYLVMSHNVGFMVIHGRRFENLTLWGLVVLGFDMSHDVGFTVLHLNIMRDLTCISHCEEEMFFEFMHLSIHKAHIVRNKCTWFRDVSLCRIHHSTYILTLWGIWGFWNYAAKSPSGLYWWDGNITQNSKSYFVRNF